ncbi:hypothetical protein [Pseudoalteromonas umbrosa]|uniref:hypothetical protein n=1 Tax=Pseudoalteromonas umbrosa TaxID=3048489 RepID=UPI0024C226AF|nr:hypothetical protein [Pseudoalteromonas sp. B95]MDK1289809.1 hypothetical protein [Pseudoalteromonas sp. B95]
MAMIEKLKELRLVCGGSLSKHNTYEVLTNGFGLDPMGSGGGTEPPAEKSDYSLFGKGDKVKPLTGGGGLDPK